MISFELKLVPNAVADELEVYFDSIGLDSVIAQLEMIRCGKMDHIHLMAESWGGSHLDDEARVASNTPLRHVKFTLV